MRVALYTDAGGVGGAETALAHLAAHLPDAVDVALLAPRPVLDLLASARPDALAIELPPLRHPLWDAAGGRRHGRAVRSLRVDAVHLSLQVPWTGWWAAAAATSMREPVVTAVEQLPHRSRSPLQRRLKRFLSRRLDAHLGVGERSARRAETVIGLPAGSMGWVHNGVPDEAGATELCPGSSRLVAVGRLDPQKGFDVLLRALALLPAEVTLSLVGDGVERDRLRRLASETGVAGRVVFQGWISGVGAALAGGDAFVLPSRDEGFPLAVLEAMLAGLPVVATDVGSVPEAVLDGETGFVVPPDDPEALAAAVEKLLSDPDLRVVMGRRGRAHALQFTAEAMARRYLALWSDLLAGRSR